MLRYSVMGPSMKGGSYPPDLLVGMQLTKPTDSR